MRGTRWRGSDRVIGFSRYRSSMVSVSNLCASVSILFLLLVPAKHYYTASVMTVGSWDHVSR